MGRASSPVKYVFEENAEPNDTWQEGTLSEKAQND